MEGILLKVALGTIQQRLTCLADTAAQNHGFGVYHTADVGQEFAHVGIDLLQNCLRGFITGSGSVEHILAGKVFQGTQGRGQLAGGKEFLCQTDNAGSGAVLFHTAALTAAAGFCFFTVEHHVADLTTGTVDTVDHIAAYDDAAAHTGTQCGKDHVLTALTAALPAFAQCGNGSIVTCLHREAGELLQGLGDVEYTPAQIDTLVDNACVVDGTGDTDADTQNGLVGNTVFVQIGTDGCGNVRQDLLAAVGGHSGDLPLVQHRAVIIKVSDLDGGTAQIYTKTEFHVNSSII